MLSTWRAAGIALVFPLAFAAACAGWMPGPDGSDSSTLTPLQEETSPPERAGSKNVKVAAPLPSEDAPGEDVVDLPRYPGSVRVAYERNQLDALVRTRARYLSAEELDAVRGFYRGVFRSEDWRVANAEFSDGEWTFLAVKGEREADIEVRSQGAGVETEMRLSEPLAPRQPEEDISSKSPPPERDASRGAAPLRAQAPEPPAPSARSLGPARSRRTSLGPRRRWPPSLPPPRSCSTRAAPARGASRRRPPGEPCNCRCSSRRSSP